MTKVAPLLCLLLSTAFAVETTPPPQAPFVATPQPGTTWNVRITYAEDAKKKPDAAATTNPDARLPRRYSSLQYLYNKNLLVRVSWTDGSQSEGYITNNQLFMKTGSTVSILPTQDEDYLTPAFSIRYTATAWVDLPYYKGVEVMEKKTCYKFHRDAINPADELSFSVPALTAWINVEDKMPVRVDIDTASYRFSTPSSTANPVELPADYQEALERLQKEKRALEALKRMNGN